MHHRVPRLLRARVRGGALAASKSLEKFLLEESLFELLWSDHNILRQKTSVSWELDQVDMRHILSLVSYCFWQNVHMVEHLYNYSGRDTNSKGEGQKII